ncbi:MULTISPECIES: glycerate kinase [unclassified Actinomyces]|uniref:glycerate kinase n=1 Tax=unclassified Actinomyces TaxID=2609248 RepID=UPI000D59BB11|nr:MULTISPECIES: glycerate kinase [unclassified Actinomyces]RAX19896.1 glycerate kinase [Actinomyces sp. Z5]RAX23453.1 glycerate kinase [Actinomyces sp. Z3]
MRVLLAPGPMYPEPGGVPLVTPETGLAAAAAADALASGWAGERPDDVLTLLPLPDGGPGTAQAIPAAAVISRAVLQARGPLGEVREVDLLRLRPAVAPRAGATGATWLLDAARLVGLPSGRDEAAREAEAGTTLGLGQALAAALGATAPGDTLIVTLASTAVHDGGAGVLDGMGGLEAARGLCDGRELLLALADDTPLGGVSGAGQSLSDLTSLSSARAQVLNRRACAAASQIAARVAVPRPDSLPVVGGEPTQAQLLSATARGTGAGGGAALVLRALGARALPGPRVLALLLGLEDSVDGQDLVVTATGEAYDVVADSVTAVVGEAAGAWALPTVLVAGRLAVPRGELAEAGIVSAYSLEQPRTVEDQVWNAGGAVAVGARLEAIGARLARTWSR